MRGLENDIEFRFFRKVPLLSYRNIGGQKTTSIFEISQKIHELVGFHGSKRKKSACLFSEADALLVVFSFTSSAGSAARSRPPWACRWTAACSERTAWPLSATGAHRRRAPEPDLFYTARTWSHLSSRPVQRRRSPLRGCGWSSFVRPIPSDPQPSVAR